jgi:hypothetical protein
MGFRRNGKGSADRTTDRETFAKNLGQVRFTGVPASEDPSFETQGGKAVKTYGDPHRPTIHNKLTSSLVIH